MTTLNGVAISPELMHSILTRLMALPVSGRASPDPQLAGLLTVCNTLKAPGDKELLALAIHIRLSALNDLVELGALRDWVLMRDGGASMDLTLPVVQAPASETVILNGDRTFAFDADRFRRCVAANAASLANDGAPPKHTRGRHPHRTGTGKPGRHAGPSH